MDKNCLTESLPVYFSTKSTCSIYRQVASQQMMNQQRVQNMQRGSSMIQSGIQTSGGKQQSRAMIQQQIQATRMMNNPTNMQNHSGKGGNIMQAQAPPPYPGPPPPYPGMNTVNTSNSAVASSTSNDQVRRLFGQRIFL